MENTNEEMQPLKCSRSREYWEDIFTVQMTNTLLIRQKYYQEWSTRQTRQQTVQFHICICCRMWFRGYIHTHFPLCTYTHKHTYTAGRHAQTNTCRCTHRHTNTIKANACSFFPQVCVANEVRVLSLLCPLITNDLCTQSLKNLRNFRCYTKQLYVDKFECLILVSVYFYFML